jgi:peptidoglycan/xylan/chitin deacetylase (PgdA/CDA1 family)
MKVVSPLLKRVIYPGLSRAGYFRRGVESFLTVLTYHGVLPAGYTSCDPYLDGNLVTETSFRNQLRLLREEYNVISPQEFWSWCEGIHQLPPRSVLLTCDDGLRNCLTEMLPLLQEFHATCLFFVTGASMGDAPAMLWYEELYLVLLESRGQFRLALPEIGIETIASNQKAKRDLWWKLVGNLSRFDDNHRRAILDRVKAELQISEDRNVKYRGDPALSRRFLTLTLVELRQLVTAGMSVGAHTMSHPILSEASPELALEEIRECRCSLERALGQPIWWLAYPFGDSSSVTDREFHFAREAGFKCAFVNTGDRVTTESNCFALPRVHVTASMTPSELQARISGLHGSLQRRFSAPQLPIPARVSTLQG